MRGLSTLLVCLLIVLAGCAGGGGGDVAADATPTVDSGGGADAVDDGSDGSGADGGGDGDANAASGSSGEDGDANAASGSSGEDDMPDAIPVFRTGERFEYDVRSAVLSEEPESGTLTVEVTEGGEWPEVTMEVVRDAPSGRMEAMPEAAAFSAALGEMAYANNIRSLVVSSRVVAGKSTDVRTYEVGDSWRFAGSDTEANFEVVAEERVAGLSAKRVRVTGGADSDLDAELWLVPGVGFPAKFVQTEDGEATIELELTAYESP